MSRGPVGHLGWQRNSGIERGRLNAPFVIDQRHKFNLTAGSSDSSRSWTERAGNGVWQKVLDAADHQRLDFRGALQGRDLRVAHRRTKRDHDLGLGVVS
jgi:hypothetical protein